MWKQPKLRFGMFPYRNAVVLKNMPCKPLRFLTKTTKRFPQTKQNHRNLEDHKKPQIHKNLKLSAEVFEILNNLRGGVWSQLVPAETLTNDTVKWREQWPLPPPARDARDLVLFGSLFCGIETNMIHSETLTHRTHIYAPIRCPRWMDDLMR